MLLRVIDQDEIAALVVVERIGIHPGSFNTRCIEIAGVCAGSRQIGWHSLAFMSSIASA